MDTTCVVPDLSGPIDAVLRVADAVAALNEDRRARHEAPVDLNDVATNEQLRSLVATAFWRTPSMMALLHEVKCGSSVVMYEHLKSTMNHVTTVRHGLPKGSGASVLLSLFQPLAGMGRLEEDSHCENYAKLEREAARPQAAQYARGDQEDYAVFLAAERAACRLAVADATNRLRAQSFSGTEEELTKLATARGTSAFRRRPQSFRRRVRVLVRDSKFSEGLWLAGYTVVYATNAQAA